MVLRCSSIAHLAHFSLLLGFPSAVAGVTVHDHSSGHSVANPHGCKSGLRRAFGWLSKSRSTWQRHGASGTMKMVGRERGGTVGQDRRVPERAMGGFQRCDVRIAFCFALLSDANAFWYDHSTSS